MASSGRIGFLGLGKMATALASGLTKACLFVPGQITGSDKLLDRREAFAAAIGAQTAADNAALVRECEIVVLAVKPQDVDRLLADIGGQFTARHLLISIAAGITTARIEAFLPPGCRVVRAMPNTPMLVGKGAAAICPGSHATADDVARARAIFEAAASVITVDERLMDAVTAVSDSGPAYFFYFVEALIQGGIEEGLAPAQAAQLATQTLVGAAALLADSGRSPAELRADVTSPGGTTVAAVQAFEAAGLAKSIIAAVHAAAERSRQLGAPKK